MAYATPSDRLALLEQFPDIRLSVQIVTRDGKEVELAADSTDHALALSGDWLRRGAARVEIVRIQPDGTVKPTIGAEVQHSTFPYDVRPGTVLKVRNSLGSVQTYTATNYAEAGGRSVQAKIRNPQMPSGWELADVLLFPGDTVVLI